MGMGFAPTWLCQVSPPLLHKTTLTTAWDHSLAVLVLRLGCACLGTLIIHIRFWKDMGHCVKK